MNVISTKDDIFELLKPDGGKFGVESLSDSYKFCKKVTYGHYENFPVGSLLIPKYNRNYFYSIYTFSRFADDIADELDYEDKAIKISSLEKLSDMIESYNPDDFIIKNPLLFALRDTILNKELPYEPFRKLITAFIMDSDFSQPESMDDNINYCKYSANPVGELVLRLFDNYDSQTALLSDSICTGLQLVNFWQDISVDIDKKRIYLPNDILQKYDIDKKTLFNSPSEAKLEACLQEIYEKTENFFIFGSELSNYIKNKRLKYEIKLTVESGKFILEKVRKLGIKITFIRPKLNKTDFILLFFKIFFSK